MSGLPFQPGEIVGGRYQLESKLGEGGMGAVWRAKHVTLKSPVAIKFVNPSLSMSENALSRFLLEAQSSAALRSTHIVQVFDFGVDNGVPYIAMELLHGESLADRLNRDRILSLNETVSIMAEAAKAMEHAHAAGIIHRDLKPDNIFLVDEGSFRITKVLDFGIAKVTGGDFEATTGGGTKTGAVLGTPYYVSPEQARGNKRVDWRTDLWALGVITYQCIVGEPPFVSDGLGDLIMKICGEPHAPPSTRVPVPAGFDEWVNRALAKDPEARFQGAVSMFDALAALVSASDPEFAATAPGAPAAPPPALEAAPAGGTTGGLSASTPQVPSRRRTYVVLLGLGGTALVSAAAGAMFLSSRASPEQSMGSAEALPASVLRPGAEAKPTQEVTQPPNPVVTRVMSPSPVQQASASGDPSSPPLPASKARPTRLVRQSPAKLEVKPRHKTSRTPAPPTKPTPSQADDAPAPKSGAALFDDRK